MDNRKYSSGIGSWLTTHAVLLGATAAVLSIVAFLMSGVDRFWPRQPQEPLHTTNAILDRLEEAHKARVIAEQKRDELRKAVEALQGDTNRGQEEALAALAEGNTEKAESLFETLAFEREQEGTKANEEAADAWRHIGALAYLHDPQRALMAYTKATQLDPENWVGWNQLGHLHHQLGDLSSAESAYQKVLSIGSQANDKLTIARATGNLGLILRSRGELKKAEEMYLESQKLYEELGHKEGMANNYGNLGNIYMSQRNLDAAEEMHLKSFAIDEELGSTEGMAITYGNLGNVYRRRGNLEKAEETYLKSLALNEELGRKEGQAINYGNLGLVFRDRGDASSAIEYWKKASDLFEELGMTAEQERMKRRIQKAQG